MSIVNIVKKLPKAHIENDCKKNVDKKNFVLYNIDIKNIYFPKTASAIFFA